MIGHSIGEFAAATLAGVMDLPDAIKLIAARGRLMSALPGGVMASVRTSEGDLQAHLSDGVDVAAINGPQSVVIAGPEAAIDATLTTLESVGVQSTKLKTSHAFHSVDEFRKLVAQVDLKAPQIAIMSTVTGDWLTEIEATDPDYWADHIRKPVRFYNAIANLWAGAPDIFLEVGPGRTLATLAAMNPDKKTAKPTLNSLPHATSEDQNSHVAVLEAFGMLWAHGLSVDWALLNPDAAPAPRQFDLPAYPFQRQRFWVEPIDVDPSGTGDSYFLELGFDSLLLTQATREISDRFGVAVTLRELIDGFSTLDELSKHIEANGSIRGKKFRAIDQDRNQGRLQRTDPRTAQSYRASGEAL